MAARTTAVVSFAIFFIFGGGCSWRGAVANGDSWGGCVDNGSSCGVGLKLSNRFFGALAGARFFFGFRPRLLGIGKQWVGTDQVARSPETIGSTCTNTATPGCFSGSSRSCVHEHADAPHPLRLLRSCRERPRRRAADERDERAPFHSGLIRSRLRRNEFIACRHELVGVELLSFERACDATILFEHHDRLFPILLRHPSERLAGGVGR